MFLYLLAAGGILMLLGSALGFFGVCEEDSGKETVGATVFMLGAATLFLSVIV